jgi:V8-like Glu-specific endopeptidase
MISITRLSLAFPIALTTVCVGAAYAGDDVAVTNPGKNPRANISDIAKAKPYSNPLPPPDTSKVVAEPPSDDILPGVTNPPGAKEGEGKAFGTFGIPYTSTRVQTNNFFNTSSANPNFLGSTYPYRTIGKLTFSAGYCSASLIKRSVIVTAAHCIQKFGTGTTVFNSWVFTPANYGPGTTTLLKAPYGSWTWGAYVRPASWANGTDIGSGSARDNDLAVMIINKNAQGQFIGDQLGWLSYGWNNYSFTSSSKTGNMAVAAVSTLGYPGLMDGGQIMQRADGPVYQTTVSKANQLWQGNNFTGGSSGGPWVVNFRSFNAALTGGAVLGTAPTMAVIGVTSWGSADPNKIKDNYSSQFRQNTRYPNASYGTYGAGNIGSVLNTLCSTVKPGTGQTFAQLGYCN